MDPCTIETGLLRKKPCGNPSVTQCLNCERPLCSQHSVAQTNDTGRKTGKFLCKECHAAWKEIEKTVPASMPAAAPAEKKAPAPAAAPAAAAAAPKAAAPAAKPGAPMAKEAPKEEKKPADDAPLEFTPTKK